MLVLVCLDIFDLYLFQFISLLNPIFNYSDNLLSSSVDKKTTGTYSVFYSKYCTCWNSNFRYGRICTRISILRSLISYYTIFRQSQRYISIKGIFNVLQKLLRCFNGTKKFVFPSSAVFPVILVLYLKDSEFVIGSNGISL